VYNGYCYYWRSVDTEVPAIVEKIAKFRALSGSQQRLLATALLLLPAFWVALQLLGLRRFNDWLSRAPAGGKPPLAFEEITAIGSLVNSAAFRLLGPGNCLTRSLYLLWLLRRRGVMSDLRIGMRLTNGQLNAHAWVDVAGQPVNDAKDIGERFAAFDQPRFTRMFSSK
jgi:hypothetical protein